VPRRWCCRSCPPPPTKFRGRTLSCVSTEGRMEVLADGRRGGSLVERLASKAKPPARSFSMCCHTATRLVPSFRANAAPETQPVSWARSSRRMTCSGVRASCGLMN
jgi:hypothetical protein